MLSVVVLAGSASETVAGLTSAVAVPIESVVMTAEMVVCGMPSVPFTPALLGVTTVACAGAKTAPTPRAVPPSVRTMRRIKRGRKNAGTFSTARSALWLETRKDQAEKRGEIKMMNQSLIQLKQK